MIIGQRLSPAQHFLVPSLSESVLLAKAVKTNTSTNVATLARILLTEYFRPSQAGPKPFSP